MSERPNKARPGGQSEGNPLGEIREGFDEIYGNIEGFSKRAVGSLFDDEEKSSAAKSDKRDEMPKLPRPVRSGRPERSAGSPGREPDPDEAYARYIRTAEKANRIDQEKQRADKAQALMDRDEKLNEILYVSKRRTEPTEIKPISRSRDIEETNLYMPAGGSHRQLNVRNLVIIGAFLILVVFALLTWQMLSARSQLAAANERIEELTAQTQEVESLRIINSGQTDEISRLNASLEQYRAREQARANILGGAGTADNNGEGGPDAPDTADGAAGQAAAQPPVEGDLPHTTIVNGQRVYTVQPGDTMWRIAERIFGDGTRHADISRANNLTEAQAEQLHVGDVLVIPD